MGTIKDMKSIIESNEAAQMGIITPEVLGRAQDMESRFLGIQKEYFSAVEEAAKEGFRPQTCIHGTNMWSDYDVMCPGCEVGDFTEWTSAEEVRELALGLAVEETFAKAREAQKALGKLAQNSDLAQSIMSKVISVDTLDDGTRVVAGFIEPEVLVRATVDVKDGGRIVLKVF